MYYIFVYSISKNANFVFGNLLLINCEYFKYLNTIYRIDIRLSKVQELWKREFYICTIFVGVLFCKKLYGLPCLPYFL